VPHWTTTVSIAGVFCLSLAHGVCQDSATPLTQDQQLRHGPVVPLQKTDPEYTDEARVAELEGTVVLRGRIGEDGLAHDLSVAEPLGLGLDEKAVESVTQWTFPPAINRSSTEGVTTQIPVDFRLSSKQSQWHLIRVQFDTPPGALRPAFVSAPYPIGATLGASAMEEGRLIVAMGRLATAKLIFYVDEHGVPVNFQIASASDPVWGSEATAVAGQWRFTPGRKNGIPISVACTAELVWGARDLDSSNLAQVYQTFDEPAGVLRPILVQGSTADAGTVQPTRILVDARAQSAKLLVRIPPEYHPAARATGLSGTVRLRLLIGADGHVEQAEAIGGEPGAKAAAAEAVKQWMYQPTLLNGTPVEVTTEADVSVGPPE